MIKKITFIFLVCCLLTSCGKKGDPEYKDPKQKVGKIILLKNKA
jgi:predicted small lipoprotein YifL